MKPQKETAVRLYFRLAEYVDPIPHEFDWNLLSTLAGAVQSHSPQSHGENPVSRTDCAAG
jgi:hypothetical protein